nr:hypothetical protein [Tanacetum cinerariifolium]
MSESEHSSVIYTSVPSPVEDYLDIGSPEVDGPPSPDYVPGPEEPEQAPLSPDYVPGPEEPEQAPLSPDYDDVFPAEEQPLPVAATPTADSPGYIPEFDPKGNLEEDDEEDPEEDPTDYPADSTVVALQAVDHIPFEEVIEPLLQIPSPPLPIPSPPPNSPTHIEIPESCLPLRKRLSFASPTPSQEVEESSAAGAARQDEPVVARDDPYSLLREEIYGFFNRVDVTPGRSLSRELEYGITDTWDELVGAIKEIAPITLQGVNQRVTDLSTIVEDRRVHRRLVVMIERERIGWLAADHRRRGVIKELLAADHKRQVQLTKALRPAQVARECTYSDFLKCQPLNFKGTEGVVGLSQWFEKMKSLYSISNCTVACQVKFATCTLQGNALTWWNSHVKTTTPEAAHAMPWRILKKMMTDKYCPRAKLRS